MKKSKCAFLQPSVEYLGHQMDAEGQRATIEKLQAILHAPSPRNVQELRSFLGLLNALLHRDCKWKWSAECEAAYTQAKEKLVYRRFWSTMIPSSLSRLQLMPPHTESERYFHTLSMETNG